MGDVGALAFERPASFVFRDVMVLSLLCIRSSLRVISSCAVREKAGDVPDEDAPLLLELLFLHRQQCLGWFLADQAYSEMRTNALDCFA